MTGKEPAFIAALPWWIDALCALGIGTIAMLPLYAIYRSCRIAPYSLGRTREGLSA